MNKIAQEIIDRLNKNKSSAYRISKDTGISDQTISNYRNGKTIPQGANLKILAKYLCIYEKSDEESIVSEPEVQYINQKDLISALNNISEAVKLNAIANERNSRNMEKMIDLIVEKQAGTKKQTGS